MYSKKVLLIFVFIQIVLVLVSCNNSIEVKTTKKLVSFSSEKKTNENKNIKVLQKAAKKYLDKKKLGYEYDQKSKTIFVYGKGEMKYNGEAPWFNITSKPPFHIPENIVICNGLISIADGAFNDGMDGNSGNGIKGLSSLKTVVIADTVKKIGKKAFYNCNALETVIIPDSVTKIDKSTFEDCDGLRSICIPGSVKRVSEKMFVACRNLRSVEIENGVQEIDTEAFSATNLNSIIIPNSIIRIGENAFLYTELKEIKIPDSVIDIGNNAFGYKSQYDKTEGFVVKGYKGSAAEKYAKKKWICVHGYSMIL